MIEIHITLLLTSAIAACLTARITPANAPAAHRLWLVVLASPALWWVGTTLFAPAVSLSLKPEVLPDGAVASIAGLGSVVLAIYVLIAAALLLRTGIGVAAVRRLLRDAQPLDRLDLARLRGLAGHSALDIRCGSIDLPVTAGFLAPAVLLPKGWRELPEGALAAILRHEAAHVRRHDCLTALVCSVVEGVAWFNPAVWIATSRVRWFAEMACDGEAARAMDGQAYASELLTLAAGWGAARRPRYSITVGVETGVARRIRLLLDEAEQGWRRRLLLPVALIVLVIVIPVSAKLRVGPVKAVNAPSEAMFPHAHGHSAGHRH